MLPAVACWSLRAGAGGWLVSSQRGHRAGPVCVPRAPTWPFAGSWTFARTVVGGGPATGSAVTPTAPSTGWLLYVPADGDDLAEEHDWPAAVPPIITLAHAYGCSYVLFDRDARRTSALPVFDCASTSPNPPLRTSLPRFLVAVSDRHGRAQRSGTERRISADGDGAPKHAPNHLPFFTAHREAQYCA